ncbi:cytochrome C oxidase subunit IV family protein [Sediminibacterium roseum]|uniref:Cytochrome C oxidase subunit IV family protein n=1 Tax=Sediminibacterium roseum TaxID=1978412 RepID=A0ABW9ZXC7_9BACT|nr:cytochrome C oxidase subunit IV family protein [Sediminibacterium roseum]NCI51805.1 cytochrome C oxidase subunit IV family protein [Sediminibacterium roseum]
MAHTVEHNEHGHQEHSGGGVKEIIKVTIILSVLTIIELILGFWMMGFDHESGMRLAIKGTIIILMLAKAFYIVSYFMHLGHELKNLIMTIVVPLALFIWFIIAFLYDGNSFRHLRNTYDPHFKEQSTIKVEKKEHGAAEKKHEGAAEEKHEDTKHDEAKH